MTDYIHEFGEDQSKRKLPVTFLPQDNWEHPIEKDDTDNSVPIVKDPTTGGTAQMSFAAEGYYNRPVTYFDPKTNQNKPADWITKKPIQQLPPQKTIKQKELKEMVSNAVIDMMNAPSNDFSLLEGQKQEIQKLIIKYSTRPGVMSIRLREDLEKDEASVGMLIDPTNTQNWVFLKEEVIYKLPYAYKDSLHSFASEVWKNRVNENIEAGDEDINQLRQQVDAANKEADARYNEVAHQSTGHIPGNVFEPNRTIFPDAREGHRNALADGQYRELKKKAIDLETKLRRLQKRIK